MDRRSINNLRNARQQEIEGRNRAELIEFIALKRPADKLLRIQKMSTQERAEYLRQLMKGAGEMIKALVEAPETKRIRSEVSKSESDGVVSKGRRIDTPRVGSFNVGAIEREGTEPDTYSLTWLLEVGEQDAAGPMTVVNSNAEEYEPRPEELDPVNVRRWEDRLDTLHVICSEARVEVSPVPEPSQPA